MAQVDLQQLEDALYNARKRGAPGVVDLDALPPLPAPADTPTSAPQPKSATIDLQRVEDELFNARKRGKPGVVDFEAVTAPAAPPPATGQPKRAPYPPSPFAGSVHAPLARRIAGEVGVPVDLFMGLIEQESAWNPKAVSKAGAQGLGQLMPGTARGLGVKDSFDPEQNLRGAARYLKAQLERFKGNEDNALAAYNAGPGAVQKYGGVPPFAETQDYIRRVKERRLRYADAPTPTPSVQKPAGRATVTKAQPAPLPAAGGLLPEEKAFQAADAAWRNRPAFAKLPGYRQAEQGPVAQLWEDRNVALAGIARVMPTLGKKFDSEKKALKPLVGTLQALEKKVVGGKATADEARRFRLLATRFQAQYERAGRINQYAASLRQTVGFAGPVGVDKPIFDTLFYRDEEKAKPGLAREFAGALYDSARNAARLVHPKGPEFAEEWLLPGEVYRGMAQQVDRERAQLQRAGVIRPLPSLAKDRATRARQIAEKNELLDLMRKAAAVSVPDETGRLYQKFNFNRDPAAFRAGVEQIRGAKLTPWQLRLLGPLHRNLKVEQQFNEKLLVAGSVDAVSEIAGDILAAFGGKAVGKLAGKALAKRLVKPTEGLLSREGMKYIATKGGARVASEAAGGALAGGVTSGAIEGGYAYSRGERGADLLKTTAKAAGAGALTGAAIGGGLSAFGMGREGAARAGRRWDPVIKGWVDSHLPKVGTLARNVKGTLTKPRHLKAEAVVSPGPQVRTADGNIINLREADADTLGAVAQQARDAGDTATVERVQEWMTRNEAWDDARAYAVPKEALPAYLGAWNKASDPMRRHADVLLTAAGNEKIAPEVRAVLANAAGEVNQTFIDGFRARLGDPFPPVGPPQVSPWRTLAPEQRRALPPDVQKALIALDAVNSQRVLDPEQVGPVALKGTSPAQWERQADALYQKAQAALTREFGELPEVVTQQGEVVTPTPAGAGRTVGETEPLLMGRAPEAEPIPAEIPTMRRDTLPEPTIQPQFAEPGALPSAYQAAEMRARAAAQPVGALDTSPQLRSQADIVASRFGVPQVAPAAQGATPVADAPTAAPAPIRSAAEIAAERAGVQPPPLISPARPIEMGRAPDAGEPRQPVANAEALQQPKPDTKPDTATGYAGPERRVDAERRKKVAEMTPEERAEALLTDEKTGLGNKRAWDEAEKKAHVGYIDADGLSFVNGAYGHPAGDALLKALGDNLLRAGFTKEDAFHISGDEFVVQGNDRADLKRRILAARELHEATVISFVDARGQTRSFKGVSFSQGIGPTEARADKAMLSEKAKRDDAGQRAKSKDVYLKDKQGRTTTKLNPAARPPGLVEVGDGGGPVQKGAGAPGPAPKRRGSGGDSQKARAVAPKKAVPKPDAAVPASTRARVKEDAAAAKARLKESGRKGGEASTPDAPRQDGKPGQFESEALRDWATENRRPSEPSEKTENAVKVWLRDTSHMFTRVYRELGPAEHPHLQTLLRRLTRHGDAIGYARAQMDIARVVAGLSDDERAFFNDLILIRDLHEDIQARREALATEEAEKLDARKNTITARYNEQRDRLMERIAGEGTALEKRREGMERQRRQLERGLAQRETDLALAGLQEGVAARGGTTDVDRLGREMAAARATIRGLEARGAERAADFDRRVAVLRAQVDAATEAINGMLESLGEAQHSGNLDRVKRLRAQMPAANARLAETEARIGVEETRKANHAAAIDRRIRIQRERLETLDGQRQMARESARAESAAKNAKMRAEERRRAVEREIGKLDTRMRVLDKRLENLKERAPERMAEADARHAARLAKEDATLPGRIAAAEAALPTPRGVSIPQIAREHRLLNEEMKQAPKVAEALRKHKALMRRVTERYLAAAEGALGKAPEFWREEHYRRLMVDEARKMVEERTRGLRAPTKRGMLKERTGKLTEYKTDYVTVQFNHLSRLVRDTLHYELLAEVRKLDITRQVYREAMRANDAGALAKLAELQAEVKKQVGAGDFKPSEKFQPLVKLAEAGLLPDDGQWGDVVDAWASSGAAMPLAVWERTGEYLKWLLEGETAAGDVVLQSVRASAQSRKKALGEAYLSPDDLVPEGYKPWRMSDSPLFEPVWREPEALADAAIDALAKEAGLPQMERRSPTLLLPENVADLMNRMGKPRADDTIGKALELTQKPRRFWTWATMFGPTRFIGGAVRDLAGNVDATIALNPHALTKLRQAGEEVHALLVKKEAPEPGSPLYEAVEKGLFTSLFANIEDGGVLKGLDLLGEAARRDQGSAGAKAVLTYMKMSQIPREIPEAVMRYAQILSFDEQVKGSPEGLPATFGASRPEVIQQLPEKERAHRLAMDVMVNYDQQNEAVEFVRAVGNPFARFAVGNMARYWRAYSNALADPRLMRRLGLRFGGRALSVGAAVYLGNLAVKTIAFGAMLEAWNRWRFGDEEDRLPPHVRSKPHLILGNHPVTGELMVLTNLSVLPSAIAWFGAEDSRGHVDDILNGRKTLRQIGQEMAKDAGRTAAGLVLGPELQAGIEGMTGRRLFPDPFDPRPIRGGAQGRVLHVLDAMIPFPFKDVRIAVAGTPDERARQAHALASLGAQPFDLGKAQYDEVRGRVFDWKAEKGKGAPSGAGSARADALYAIRTGARFMDTQRMRQALQVYSLNNGTLEGLYGAVASLDPFNGMDRRAVREFVGKMNTGDRQRVKEAMAWYASAFAPHGRAPLAEKVSLKLGTEFTDADNDAGMIPLDSYIRSTGRMVEREWAKAVRRTLREMPEEKRELRRNERGR